MGESSADAGLFEFDQLSDSEGGEDPSDTPDQPDPPDDDSANNEPSTPEGADSTTDEADPTASTGDTSSSTEDEGGDSGEETSGDDAPDPPDPSDDGSGFYEFNPVEESQTAFQFAEKQSRAAAESAYKHAAGSLIGRFVRKYTNPEVRKRLDEVFSRRMLGSVFVGGAFSKIIESSIEVYFGASSVCRPVMWLTIFSSSTIVFVWWEHLTRRASEAAEKASETADKASEAASETADKASEAASEAAQKASETASEATGNAPESETAEVVSAGVTNAVGAREGGASAATRAGENRPIAVRFRSPARRPNKRFEDGERASELIETDRESVELAFEGSGFENPADAAEFDHDR